MELIWAVLVIYLVIVKGLALWRSARLGQPIWFGVMLVLQTAGVLELFYLFTHREPSRNRP